MTWQILEGDCREILRTLPAQSVQTCVTSPPYFGLRDYGTGEWDGSEDGCDHKKTGATKTFGNPAFNEGRPSREATDTVGYRDVCGKCGATRIDRQIGLEPTPDEFVAALVEVFREVRRVLRDDGTVWLNLGDSYAGSNGTGGTPGAKQWTQPGSRISSRPDVPRGVKPKDLIGIPWECAKAFRAPYYAGQIKRERDRVWLAATLDAEGSICAFTHERSDGDGTRTGVHVTITNTSQRLLDEAHRIWPASRSEHENHGSSHLGLRPSWRWICHGAENKANLMRELFPYLIAKKDQACLAYTFAVLSMDAKRLGHSPQRDDVRGKRAWLVDAMSRLNRGEDFDFPAWVQEPPSMFEPGWYLRSDIIWAKPNPMPESVTDRPTKAHEYLFLLSKGPRYFYDADAIREDGTNRAPGNKRQKYMDAYEAGDEHHRTKGGLLEIGASASRNRRTVWTVATQPYSGAHFATFPPKLIEPCILAGSGKGDVVLDPFVGSGTTGVVAGQLQRDFVGCELNPEYAAMARERILVEGKPGQRNHEPTKVHDNQMGMAL